jgi:hypothetical protein
MRFRALRAVRKRTSRYWVVANIPLPPRLRERAFLLLPFSRTALPPDGVGRIVNPRADC